MTCITALVLFLIATAGVKGFALMLLVGTVISLVTAVFATRAMLGLLARLQVVRATRGSWARPRPRSPSGSGSTSSAGGGCGSRSRSSRWCSASWRSPCKGLNLGIDFKGGTQVTFDTPTPQLVETVRARRCARSTRPRQGSDPGQGTRDRREVQELPPADGVADAEEREQAAQRPRERAPGDSSTARRTSPRASAGRSSAARLSRSSSRSR